HTLRIRYVKNLYARVERKVSRHDKSRAVPGPEHTIYFTPLAILRALDLHIPGGSGLSVSIVTNDVYQYVRNPGVRDNIDDGVRAALSDEVDNIVVSHSLGTIVAYALLTRDAKVAGWRVPFFMTLGSPLAITMIKNSLRPIKVPSSVKK